MAKRLGQLVFWLIILITLILLGFRLWAWQRENQVLIDARPNTGNVIETSLGQIFVTVTGNPDNTPVLFVHGTAAWGGLWQESADAIRAAGFYSIAMDLPPFGYSTRDPNSDYSRETQAQRITALVDKLDVRPIIVAHSFGAAPAVEAAMIAPEKFSGIVLVAGAVGMNSHLSTKTRLPFPLNINMFRELLISATYTNPLATKQLVKLLIHRKEQAKEPYLSILRQPSRLTGSTNAFSDWLPSLLVPSKTARSTRLGSYRDLSLPMGLIWGDSDTISPLAQGQEIANAVSDSQLFVMDRVGHMPFLENPLEFQNHLTAALTKIRSGFQ